MKKTLGMMGMIGMMVCGAMAQTTTVQWNLKSMFGANLNRRVLVAPVPEQNPRRDGTNIVIGAEWALQPTNGVARGTFYPGDYLWAIEGLNLKAQKMSVFLTNAVLNAVDLTTNLVTYVYTNLPSVAGAVTNGQSMVSFGGGTATGANSLAEGEGIATGVNSHAEGTASAAGGSSHAEGGADTLGDFSHAEGYDSEAGGIGSHAEGASSAYGYASHSEGSGTATGDFSHAAGNSASATNDYAFVWSDGTSFGSTTNRQFSVFARSGIRLMGGEVFLGMTTNQISFGGTNSPPLNASTPAAWVSVQVAGSTNAYRIPLYK